MSEGSTVASAPKTRPGGGGPPGASRSRFDAAALRRFGQRWMLLGILFAMIGAFSLWQPDEFAQWSNFQSIVNTTAPLVFIALAAVVVLVVGEFDISLGAILGLCQYVILWLVTQHGVAWELAIVLTLMLGAFIGFLNAVLVKGIGINCFIATIGMASVMEGVLSWISDQGNPIFTGAPAGLKEFGQTELLGLTLPVYYALGIAIVAWFLLERTVFGREMRATGSNRQAAILSGLRTNKAVIAAFVLAGILAAAGGIIATARIGAADATSGPSYLLPAYAAAFLGAIAVRPGFENVWGTVIALFVVAVGVVGLQLAGAQAWVTDVFNGMVLLIAVSAAMLSSKMRARGSIRRIFSTVRGGSGRAAPGGGGSAPPPAGSASG